MRVQCEAKPGAKKYAFKVLESALTLRKAILKKKDWVIQQSISTFQQTPGMLSLGMFSWHENK